MNGPRRIQAIILSPTPRSPNQIRSLFLQLTAISKFCPKLAELKHPIVRHERGWRQQKGSESLDDIIIGRKDGSSKNTYSKLSGRGLGSRSVGDSDTKFSSAVIAINSMNSEKISSSRRVPSMEWRILLPSSRRVVDIKDHSFSPNSKIELFLFNSNNCISSVKKRLSQDEGNFAVFFHFEDNKISRKGLRVSRDSFAYKDYGLRLMLAPRSAKALQEKVLLKLHGIRKLPGSPSFGGTLFWIIAELSLLKKATEICLILCLLLMSSLSNFP
ncbi:hypothetical protein Tco_0769381 [Tanacetum coccineum]|uniref:Uncharacterized protein n=1 Tax=Tanacetum coccineum TaxID=301880 RepID=A0ABQ4Z9K8_9ASTR